MATPWRGLVRPRLIYLVGSVSAPTGLVGAGAAGLASSPFGAAAGGLVSCFGVFPPAPSTFASRATVIAKLADPSMTTSVGTVFTFELTNAVVLESPAPSKT